MDARQVTSLLHKELGGFVVLSRVEYEFFDFEEPSSNARELWRQIRLLFSDAPPLFVSWTWERQHGPDDQPYSIAYAESSYFTGDPAYVIDASGSALWSCHLGQAAELVYAPSSSPELEYHVLTLRSGLEATYMYSRGVDRVFVSNERPF
jgi:hypothetical protein